MAVTSLQIVVGIICVERLDLGQAAGLLQQRQIGLPVRRFLPADRLSRGRIGRKHGGFDLPVLHYRALVHGIAAPRYWENGEEDQSFRWNNYLSRYHQRHTDLMDILSGYQPRAVAPLDEIATLLGFPGKMGMSGALVWDNYLEGNITGIRNYCETDVLNTYLVYQRYELMRGRISAQEYQGELQRVRDYLQAENKPHFNEFLSNWPA